MELINYHILQKNRLKIERFKNFMKTSVYLGIIYVEFTVKTSTPKTNYTRKFEKPPAIIPSDYKKQYNALISLVITQARIFCKCQLHTNRKTGTAIISSIRGNNSSFYYAETNK